jgi:hypothetical protein
MRLTRISDDEEARIGDRLANGDEIPRPWHGAAFRGMG